MPTIEIAGQKVLLDIVHHDSGEEPESACTNTLTAVKVGDVTYQYLNMNLPEALRKIAAAVTAAARLNYSAPPKMLTIVISKFHQETSIDWKSAVSTISKLEALGLADKFLSNAPN